MVSTTVKVISSEGLTGDIVNQLTNELAKYDFDITLAYNGTKTTANSSLGVMSLGVPDGAKIELSVDGTTDQLESVVSTLVDHKMAARI
ncbi:HPr family phosphocarrier protein [Secundilactobacillus silagei]|uniref:Phosphocarrier protein HPr n=1 Tax=Secundilactobacillus silagei JCM 19001 TaxID=1302250 RepID=A0A1Z5IIT9_9LACO|nr:HPr family phosphocarrier protein [Secundilactobacillus silagei]TDG71024.1 hypothetical protein C5L25_001212 [Secundilactobacillus silagei JCM 19001]GAX01694.1 phosphocarrier protein HPr [Secundilactobacillus silagei JCM 19001]